MVGQFRIPKSVKSRVASLWKQNSVVDSTKGKFTAVSLIPYCRTTGIITRYSGKPTLIGYCVESPREVLGAVFEDYHVTRYNGYELFSSKDLKPTTPMLGLGIAPIRPPKVYGIKYTGRLEDLLQLSGLSKVKRGNPISPQDAQRIVAYLSNESESERAFTNPNCNQHKRDRKEIIQIVEKFG